MAKPMCASFQREGQALMKGKYMKTKISKKTTSEELATLAAMSDDDIDFSDIPELTENDWEGAVRGKFYRPLKQQLTVRIDADVLDWLRNQSNDGRGYQSRMNQILRAAMINSVTSQGKL
jgi:uncharacterized protein (DUF4415 family)